MKAGKAGVVSALLASVCCIGPLLLVAIGLASGAAFIGRYHWFFVSAAIAVLAWAWVKHFREKARCACERRVMDGRGMSLLTLLLASAIVMAFAALNISSYVFASSPPAAAPGTSVKLQRVTIPVEGMSCATCEIAVRSALKRVDGVASAHVSVATRTATVDYESAKTDPNKLVAAINSTGYRASVPRK